MIGYQFIKKEELTAYKAEVENLNKNIKDAAEFISEIGKGNLSVEYKSNSEDDILRSALLVMKEQLINFAKEEQNKNWANQGLALFANLLRMRYETTHAFAEAILHNLVKYLNVNQGGLFILNDDDTSNPYLELASCYAYERKKFLEKTIRPGEGLLGEAFYEKETIYITELPDQYTTITSGLGTSTPSALLVVPLKYNEEVIGVIELASFVHFEKFQIEFVEKIAESTATALLSLRINERTERLLHETREQTENLRAQEEEMRQNIEELQATQEKTENMGEELKKSKALLEQTLKEHDDESERMINYMEGYKKILVEILDELPQKVFVKDNEGKFVLVNTAVAHAHHLSIEKLLGTSDFDHFPKEQATEYRKQELSIINGGKPVIFEHEENISGKKKILKTMKKPIFLHHLGQPGGLLGIQTDITELREMEEKINNTL